MWKWALAVIAVALAVSGVIYVPRLLAFAAIGATYAAQQTCACVHVSGRTLESCTAELGKAGKMLHVDAEGDTVHASALFGLFTGEARNETPFGCHPVK